MSKHLYKVLPLLLLALSYACGSSSVSPYYASSQAACRYVDIDNLPENAFIDVSYIRQDVNYCGPASLSMVMSYYGNYVEQHVLGDDIVGNNGASSFDLVSKANEYMFNGSVTECSLGGVLNILSEGKPVIARISNDAGNGGHFVVLTGYDKSSGLIYLNDPDQPYRKHESMDEFQKLWNITNLGENNNSHNLIILVYPSINVAQLGV